MQWPLRRTRNGRPRTSKLLIPRRGDGALVLPRKDFIFVDPVDKPIKGMLLQVPVRDSSEIVDGVVRFVLPVDQAKQIGAALIKGALKIEGKL